MREIELRRVAAAAKRAGGAKDRVLAQSVPPLLQIRANVIDEVERMRALINPLVRAWDVLTEAEASKLPAATRTTWEELVVAFVEADPWHGTEVTFRDELPAKLEARLAGAGYMDLSEGGRIAEVGQHWTSERPADFENFFHGDPNSRGRQAKTHAPDWNDIGRILDSDAVGRIAILAAWSSKAWWSRGNLTQNDWAELTNGIRLLAEDIQKWEQRRDRLRQVLEDVETLRAESARPTKTLMGGGWDVDLSIYNPGRTRRQSGDVSRLKLDGYRVEPTEQRSTVGKDIDRIRAYLNANPPSGPCEAAMLPSRTADRVGRLTRDLR